MSVSGPAKEKDQTTYQGKATEVGQAVMETYAHVWVSESFTDASGLFAGEHHYETMPDCASMEPLALQ